jgi:hypothetical protein
MHKIFFRSRSWSTLKTIGIQAFFPKWEYTSISELTTSAFGNHGTHEASLFYLNDRWISRFYYPFSLSLIDAVFRISSLYNFFQFFSLYDQETYGWIHQPSSSHWRFVDSVRRVNFLWLLHEKYTLQRPQMSTTPKENPSSKSKCD